MLSHWLGAAGEECDLGLKAEVNPEGAATGDSPLAPLLQLLSMSAPQQPLAPSQSAHPQLSYSGGSLFVFRSGSSAVLTPCFLLIFKTLALFNKCR